MRPALLLPLLVAGVSALLPPPQPWGAKLHLSPTPANMRLKLAAAPVEPEIPVAASEVRTELTEEQRAALQAFAEIDIDGDGELTADEIYQALSKREASVSLERVQEIVAAADTDGNGTVSQQEYVEAVAKDLVPASWLGALGRQLVAKISAAFAAPEPEPVLADIDAPQGALGLQFERDSNVVFRIKEDSPLTGQVEAGWTLVCINSNGSVLDTSALDGWAVTNLLGARAQTERKLTFKKTAVKQEFYAPAPVAAVGQVVAVQPGAWQPPLFVTTPQAAEIVAWQHPEAAALEALRTFFTELSSLDGDASTITKAEFAACCANPEVGPQISNQDAVFDCARPVWKLNFTAPSADNFLLGTRLTSPFTHRSRRGQFGRDLARRVALRRRGAVHG